MKKALLTLEFTILYAAIPAFLALGRARGTAIPMLLLAAGYCASVLVFDRSFDRKQLWNAGRVRAEMPRILRVYALAAALLTAGVLLFAPGAFLSFVHRAPLFWGIVMVLYPVLSVYPQELIFRAFLFHRYRALFRTTGALVAASALAFSFVHIIYGSPVSLLLALAGGYLFADTYRRSHSLLASSIEHALYGDLVFTIGLGMYFFRGAGR